jgi:hypothetical protein
VLTILGTLRFAPEREHDVPLSGRNEQLNQSASNIRSAGGESEVRNPRVHGEQGKNAQGLPEPAPELAYHVGRDEVTVQDATEGNRDPPALSLLTEDISGTGGVEIELAETSKGMRR